MSLKKSLKSLKSFATSISGVSNRTYQKYSDFKHLTGEQILELPLDQISTTMLNNDHNKKELKHDQLSAVHKLIALKNLSNKGATITPEFRQSRIDRVKGHSLLDEQVDKLIVDTDRQDREGRELELRHKRLIGKLTEEEAIELRLIELANKGGRRNAKKTKMQTKKKTNKKKRRTYKK